MMKHAPYVFAHLAPFFVLLFALITITTPARGEALGRLFYTPAERAVLDRQRQVSVEAGQTEQHINGIVRPSVGKPTVWIDGIPQDSPADENQRDSRNGKGPAHIYPGR